MKIVTVQEDKLYLLWQVELQAYNLHKLGRLQEYYPIVFYQEGKDEPSDYGKYLLKKGIKLKYLRDTRKQRHYAPSIKPYGIAKLLEELPELGKEIFVIDSDVIFRKFPDISKLQEKNTWYVSDTVGYIGYNYIASKPDNLIDTMSKIVGIDPQLIQQNEANSGGAQYYLKDIDAAFCYQVEEHSVRLYDFLKHMQDKTGNDIQIWTAEMWAWLWNGFKKAHVKISPELAFTWADSPVKEYENASMLHMAGVVDHENKELFDKSHFADTLPFGQDFSTIITANKYCSVYYVKLIHEYSQVREKVAY